MTISGRLFKNTLSCSFCGKSQHDVQKLIAGPRVFICDECVMICLGILQDAGPAPVTAAPMQRRGLLDRLRDWLAYAMKGAAIGTLSRLAR